MTIFDTCADFCADLKKRNGDMTVTTVNEFTCDVLNDSKPLWRYGAVERALLDAALAFLSNPTERENSAWLKVLAQTVWEKEAFLQDARLRVPEPLSWPKNNFEACATEFSFTIDELMKKYYLKNAKKEKTKPPRAE
jgi:hypothetical protein